MTERRKPAQAVTPGYEDAGIFKGQIVQIVAELVPVHGRNTRHDIMIKGFVSDGGAIDVVFPGRRKKQAEKLLAKLGALWTQAQRMSQATGKDAALDEVRFPIRLEGAWRPRFQRDDQGWETRQHQFYAARWAVVDGDGNSVTSGEPVLR